MACQIIIWKQTKLYKKKKRNNWWNNFHSRWKRNQWTAIGNNLYIRNIFDGKYLLAFDKQFSFCRMEALNSQFTGATDST